MFVMDNKLSKMVGLRINTLLGENDITQKQLAKYLSVQDNTISYFVSGKRIPNTSQIKQIAEYFNVTTDYLLGRTNAKSEDVGLKSACDYLGIDEKAAKDFHDNYLPLRPYFNHLFKSGAFTELSYYLERLQFNSFMSEHKGLGEEQNRKNRERAQLYMFYAQEFIKDCFKEYLKDGEQNAHNPKTQE